MSTPTTSPPARWPGAALAASAIVLAGLLLTQLGRIGGPAPAYGSMRELVAANADMTLLTADAGGEDVAVVLDQRGETLLIYRVVGQQRLDFMARQSVRELFFLARQAQGAAPLPDPAAQPSPPAAPPAPPVNPPR